MSAPNTVASTDSSLDPGAGSVHDTTVVNPVVTMPSGTDTSPVGGMGEVPQSFHSSSLYVGDLVPEVNEGLLFEIFNAVGPVSSIRVCRDAVTRRSLGYAYVNFHQIADAERALDTMNYTEIKDKPCRIMWSQRDPSLRRSGVGNIFVKNLKESIDNKQLYDTFSLFGNILSCKVVTDRETGLSKGYGYVHYETSEDAHAAIEKLDGMLIDGQEVQVGEFMRRNERPGQSEWTNCYVKNIPLEWDDARLKEEFSKFGGVLSAAISMGLRKRSPKKKDTHVTYMKDEGNERSFTDKVKEPEQVDEETNHVADREVKTVSKGVSTSVEEEFTSLGFGFVNFEEHEAAVLAVEQLNGKEVKTVLDNETDNQALYVGRAQKKGEREYELQAKFEAQKMDRISKFQGVNLYIKNIDDSVTDEVLRDAFATMGNITSACVMKDVKGERSRGFGFVCYSTPEEATRAVNEMNGQHIANKPIYVALAQGRDARRAQLEVHHSQRASGQDQPMMRGGGLSGPMGYRGSGMSMYMHHPGLVGGIQPTYPMMHQVLGTPGRGVGRGGYPMMQPQDRGNYSMPGYGSIHQQVGRGGRITNQSRSYGRGSRTQGQMQPRGGGVPGRGVQPGNKFNQHARNVASNVMTTPSPIPTSSTVPELPTNVPPPTSHEALTAAALVSASPEMQKNMIGERLYPLIYNNQPEHAGKITGMLLEMDNSELLHLLESPDALNAKIAEAIQVLEAHSSTGE